LKPDEKIGPTAHYTAYIWYRLGLPYSELFATRQGASLFWGLRLSLEWMVMLSRRLPLQAMHLEARHKTIDHQLSLLDPDRVVEIGSGLSRRGVTWAADHRIKYTEADLPHMIAAKQSMLNRAPPDLQRRLEDRLRLVPMSVRDPRFGDWLCEELAGSKRAVVIMEGLIVYFDLSERIRIANIIRKALESAGGGHFLCDLPIREYSGTVAFASSVRRMIVKVLTSGRGVGEFPSRQVAREFLVASGFNTIRQLENATRPNSPRIRLPERIWLSGV
jgi:O-methyltransferase involved in polyketide biosynthesis